MDIKKIRFLLTVLLALSLSFTCHYAQAKGKAAEVDLDKPDMSEVLEEVSKFTGLSSEVVGVIHEDTAELFEGLDNLVFAGKVVSLITEAKDTEALTEIGMKALEVCKDKLLEQALPAAANTFLTVASVYKTSLELIRDYKWIPGYEEKIYRAYKESRDKDREENIRIAKKSGKKVEDESKYEDTSEEGRSTAFNMGVMTKASGYYVVKGKMLDEMAKEKLKLKSQEELGPQALKIFNRQVDEFWINRLEMRYQKERMKARKAELIKEIWAKKAQQIEAIKEAAGKLGISHYFIKLPQDLPQGWWKVEQKEDKDNGVPFEVLTPRPISEWRQYLYCSRDQGFKLRRDSNGTPIYDSLYDDKTKQWRHLSFFHVSVSIQSYITKEGKLFGIPPPERLDLMVKSSGYRYLTEMEQAVTKGIDDGSIRLSFFKNGYFVDVDVDGSNNNANSTPTEAMAIHFAKCIASHMESKVKKGK